MVFSVSSLVYASIKIIYVLKAPNEGSKILETKGFWYASCV